MTHHPATTQTPAIALDHAGVTYPGSAKAALHDLSLTVPRGQYLCVLGANGSGKSTLIQLIGALIPVTAGTASILGHDPMAGDGALEIRRRCASVFQHPEDQMVTSIVAEDVAFGPENLCVPSSQIAERVDRSLAAVGMSAYAQSDPADLSGGQKQRVAIAGALAMEPDILLLDEPAAMLDTEGRHAIQGIIDDLREQGITIVHVTHFMDDALRADRVIVMHEGALALDGTPAEVFAHRERIRSLGLETPFAFQLVDRLAGSMPSLPATGDTEELARAIARELHARHIDEENASLADASPELAGAPAEPSPDTAPATPSAGDTPPDTAAPAQPAGPNDAPAAQPAIVFDAVDFSYAAPKRRRTRRTAAATLPLALSSVSFELEPGTITALIGTTGSGKSTTVELACALKDPLAGTVSVSGIDTADLERRRELRRTVGYVSQLPERQLFAENVFEDVAFGPRNLGLDEDQVRERVLAALRATGLEPDDALLARSPFSLSGGQQRCVAIAGVLAMEQPVLILDEPMAGLDPAGRATMRDLMRDLRRGGTTLLMVTHDMDDVAALADRALVLDRGHLTAEGTPRELFCQGRTGALGIPDALAFARELAACGVALAREPLTLDDLTREVMGLGTAR